MWWTPGMPAPAARATGPARLRRGLVALVSTVLAVGALSLGTGPASARTAPTQATWLADVSTAMHGARPFLRDRAAQAGPEDHLAINLDIDNTSLATYYQRGQAVRTVRNAARLASRLGITLLFNTGRLESRLGDVRSQLIRAGYAVGTICTRNPGELLPASKQRCRQSFVDQGFTIVANIGNNDTDFVGTNYERAFRLPNYDGELG